MTSIKPPDTQNIPVLINNRDRLGCLKQLIDWLERARFQRIYIVDNDSSYEPLLNYYAKTPHTVLRLGRNVGFLSIWQEPIQINFQREFYIYTDPDVVPAEDCPLDAAEVFADGLMRYPHVDKVGFGLKIDDLPVHARTSDIIEWEQRFWTDRVDAQFFRAEIDTTFALYRPGARGASWLNALRSDAPYVARHLPWYEDPQAQSEETKYYTAHARTSTHWTANF